MTTPPGAPGAKPGKGSWFKRNKWVVLGAGAVAGVAALAIIKGRSGSGSSSTSAGSGSVPSGAVTYADNSGDYNSLEGQIANLQNQLAGMQATPGPAGPPGPRGKPGPRNKRPRNKTVPPGRRKITRQPPVISPPHKVTRRR